MMNKININKYKIALVTLPFIILIISVKLILHSYGLEFLKLNTLFSAIISANIFIIGFLISSVLSDYKESERLPSELAQSLESIYDDSLYVYENKNNEIGIEVCNDIKSFALSLNNWIKKEYKTNNILLDLGKINEKLFKFETSIQANYIVRLKNELAITRRIIKRIDTIRDTNFNLGAYAITELLSSLLVIGLIFMDYDPYYEGIFFVVFVSFVLIYMVIFIGVLDNPYKKTFFSDPISFKPLNDFVIRCDLKSKTIQ